MGNMRANGLRSLDVSRWLSHHQAIISAAPWPDADVRAADGCSRCVIIGADARPNWRERALPVQKRRV
jgi:hypothetical protein